MTPKLISVVACNEPSLLEQVPVDLLTRFDPKEILFLAEGIARRCPELSREAIFQPLRDRKIRRLDDWRDRLLDKARPPSPPWTGQPGIAPILDAPTLRVVAARFKNCLRGNYYWKEVLRGDTVYYLCEGRRPAVVRLDHDRLLDGWFVGEMKGRRNVDLPKAAARPIIEAFADAGFPCFPEDNHITFLD